MPEFDINTAVFDSAQGPSQGDQSQGNVFDIAGVKFDEPTRPDRGWLADLGSSIARGVAVRLPGSIGHMLKTYDPEGGVDYARDLGDFLTKWEEEAPEKYEWARPSKAEGDKSAAGFLRRGMTGTFESAPESMAPMALGALGGGKVGAAIGTVIAPGVGTAVGGIAGALIGTTIATLGTFGASAYNRAYEEAKKQGKDETIARSIAKDDFWSEGGIEAGANVLEVMTLGLTKGIKPLVNAGKQTLKQMLKIPIVEGAEGLGKETVGQMLKTPFKEVGKDILKTMPVETGTEMLQGYIQAKNRQSYGMETETPFDSVVESILPSIGMTVLFGLGAHGINRQREKAARNALTDPTTDMNERRQAAAEITAQLKEQDPELAEVWDYNATDLINQGKAINIEEKLADMSRMPPVMRFLEQADSRVDDPKDDFNLDTLAGLRDELGDKINDHDLKAINAYIDIKRDKQSEPPIQEIGRLTPQEILSDPDGIVQRAIDDMNKYGTVFPGKWESKTEYPEDSIAGMLSRGVGGRVVKNLDIFDRLEKMLGQFGMEEKRGPGVLKTPGMSRPRQDAEAKAALDAAAHEAATSPLNDKPEPSEAQIETGTYEKGHYHGIPGLDISIENPKGSVRKGVSPEGKPWETELKAHYGYIRRTMGVDGDQVDTFIGDNPTSDKVFVVYQNDPKTGKFDEHKAMLAYNSIDEARAGYLANYEPGWKGMGAVVPMTMDVFKNWLKKTTLTKKGEAPSSTVSAQTEAQPGDFYEFDVPTRPEGPTTYRYKVRSLFVQDDGTIVPLVKDLKSNAVYPIFPSIAANGRFVKAEEGLAEGAFPMGQKKPAAGTPIPAPTEAAKKAKQPKTLIQTIMGMGGISAEKVKAAGYNIKEDFQQHGLSFVFRKGGMGLDDLVTNLVSAGVITEPPAHVDGGDYLLDLMQKAAKKQKVTIDEIQSNIDVAVKGQKDKTSDQQRDILELKEDLKRNGANESQIEDAVAAYQGETRGDQGGIQEDQSPQGTQEEAAATRDSAAGTDEEFVSEVEEPTEETPSELRPAESSKETTALTPTEDEKGAQTPQRRDTGGELFHTSSMFTLSGNQPFTQGTMQTKPTNGDRLLDVEKQNTDELRDRLSGEKAKREYEETKHESILDQARRNYTASEREGSEDAGTAIIDNYFNHILTPVLKKMEKGKRWFTIDELNKKSPKILSALKKTDVVETAWDKDGNAYHALKGTPLKEGLTKEYKAAETKEPWRMTAVEASGKGAEDVFPLESKVEIENGKPVYKYSTTVKWGDGEKTFEVKTKGLLNGTQQAERLHKEIVKQALSDGKPVPEEVLKDYPELAEEQKPWFYTQPVADVAEDDLKDAMKRLANNDEARDRYNEVADELNKRMRGAPGRIQDFGEKIGGARKDTAERGFTITKREGKEDTTPAWKKRFVAMELIKRPGTWAVFDSKTNRTNGQHFQSQEEAEKAVPLFAVAQQHQVLERDGEHSIYKRVGERKHLKVVNQSFSSREEAMKYMVLHAEELLSLKTSFGEEILPVPEKAYRKGSERRNGNATPEMFMETFTPRGIEFGNWNNQEERQQVMNHAYDGLLDLADALSIEPKALMLNGELAIAFGARGQGLSGAKAHYEPGYGVINLTKMKGAGSLAHEWFHAFDHYLARLDTKAAAERKENKKGNLIYPVRGDKYDFQSHGPSYKTQLRTEVAEAYKNLIESLYKKAQQYVEDTQQAERFLGKARDNLRYYLNEVRRYLASDYSQYYKTKFGNPASAEQLAEFDRLADILIQGGDLETEFRKIETKQIRSKFSSGGRYTNDTLEAINGIMKAVRNRQGFNSEQTGMLDRVKGAMGLYSTRIKMLDDAEKGTEKTRKAPTSYAIEAKKMDQARASDYWSTPHEMAARAFAAYVEDKIAEKGGQSDFLVYQARGGILLPMIDGFIAQPYPEGKEREAINKAFDDFVGTLETKETDKGVMLFKKERVPEQDTAIKENLREMVEDIISIKESGVDSARPSIYNQYGNEPVPIGKASRSFAEYVGVSDPLIYSGKAYFLDHHFNNHPKTDPARYLTIPDVLLNPDSIRKDDRKGHEGRYIFIRNYDKYHAVIVDIGVEDGKLTLYKTFFTQQREPYKNYPEVKLKEPVGEGGDSSIGPASNEAPAETISALPTGSEANIANESRSVKEAESEDNKPSFRTAETGMKAKGPYKAANLENLLRHITTKVRERTGVTVKVIQNNYGFPIDFVERAGGDFNLDTDKVYGAYDPRTDTVYLVADNMESTSAAEKILFEELVGHKGLPEFLGREKTAQMRSEVFDLFKNDPGMKRIVKDYGLDTSTERGRQAAGNEFMIHNIERPTLMARVAAFIRDALRRMGFRVRLTDAEIRTAIGNLMNEVERSMMPGGRGQAQEAPAFRQQKPVPAFYSQLMRTVENKLNEMPGKAQSIIPWLTKQQVKPMEIEELGVKEWLDNNQKDGKIDKTAFAEFVKANQIQVEEVTKGTPYLVTDEDVIKEWKRVFGEENYTPDEVDMDIPEMREQLRDAENVTDATKFGSYVLPGGDNYREMLFTLPPTGQQYGIAEHPTDKGKWVIERSDGSYILRSDGNMLAWPSREAAERGLSRYSRKEQGTFTSSHWDEPNVVAHARFQDFTDKDGSKVLLVEEVQSDWHQEGKKEGYQTDLTGWKVVELYRNDETGRRAVFLQDPAGNKVGEAFTVLDIKSDEDILRERASGVPNAPFKQNWHEYVMKRMIRYAAENGYDKIAWTPGEQQAERYDLSKQIDSIDYIKDSNGTYRIVARKDGRLLIEKIKQSESDLANLVGKEIAQKIASHAGEDTSAGWDNVEFAGTLSGLDLKVGGKGMKVFYDQLIPGFLNKYVKQWSSRVGTTEISTGARPGIEVYTIEDDGRWQVWDKNDPDMPLSELESKAEAEKYINELRGRSTVYAVPITPAMRDAVLYEGQPLYRKKGVDSEQTQFANTLDKYLSGQLGKRLALTVSSTPAILQKLGAKDLPVIIMDDTVEKVLHDKHGMAAVTLKELPAQLHDPIAVFDSSTAPRAFVVMTGLKNDKGENIIAAVHLSIQYGRHELNKVASIHGREDRWFEEQRNLGRLRYINREKALNWSMTANRLLSVGVRGINQGSDRRILTERDFVKPDHDDGISFKKTSFKQQVRDEADNVLKYITEHAPANLPQMSFMERMLKNPLWYDHPVMKKIFDIMMRKRSEWYHERFNDYNDAGGDKTVAGEMHALKNSNPRAYEQLQSLLITADTEWVKDKTKTFEERIAGLPIDAEAKRIALLARAAYDKILEARQKPMKELIKEIEAAGYEEDPFTLMPHSKNFKAMEVRPKEEFTEWTDQEGKKRSFFTVGSATAEKYGLPAFNNINYIMGRLKGGGLEVQAVTFHNDIDDTEAAMWWDQNKQFFRKKHADIRAELRQTLKTALMLMDEWRGYYSPRLREYGKYQITASREREGATEFWREHAGEYGSLRAMKRLASEGWSNIERKEIEKLPETIYGNIKSVDVAQALAYAARGMKKTMTPELHAKFNEDMIEQAVNMIRERGSEATKIHRQKGNAVKGYIEDPEYAFVRYASSIAGGSAKADASKQAAERLLDINPAKEPRAYEVARKYIEENLRNADTIDKYVAIAKSVATFKFLGFNPRSPLVNMTAMVTSAPAAVHQYAGDGKISMGRVTRELARAGRDFAKFMTRKGRLDPETQSVLEEFKRKGEDDPQLTRDALAAMQGGVGKTWDSIMRKAMWMFGITEQWNRGSTLLAAYRVAKDRLVKDGIDEATAQRQAAEIAADATVRAHAGYGKANLPEWAQGTTATARVGQAMYMYGNFGHNYVQMLYDLGFKKKNIAAFTWALVAPIVLVGGAGIPFKDELAGILTAILRVLGISQKPFEKIVWDGVRDLLGERAELAGRRGAMGLAGIDISGSLGIGVGLPTGFLGMMGAIGGVIEDMEKGQHLVKTGQPGRAAEKMLPTAFANVLRSLREADTGITTEKGARVWDESGRPLQPSSGETAFRVIGFKSPRQSVLQDRAYEIKEMKAQYTDRRKAIYEEARAYFADPKRTRDEWAKIWDKVKRYNDEVLSAKLRPEVPIITPQELHQQAKNLMVPPKGDRARMALSRR